MPCGVKAGGQLQSPNLKATHRMTHPRTGHHVTPPESSVRQPYPAAGVMGPV